MAFDGESERLPKVGWIGCGRQAKDLLIPELVRLPVSLAAVCSRNEENLSAVASRYGVKGLYRDYREMLEREALDAVFLSVGPAEHAEMAVTALSRGLAVFTEKPPGASAEDAARILEASRRAGKPVGIGFHKRFSVGNRIAKNIAAGKDFGKIAGLAGEFTTAPGYFSGDPSYRSFFLHHCVHYCDLFLRFAGPAAAVRTESFELEAGKALFHVFVRFESGALGTLVLGTLQSRGNPVEYLRIYGDHKRIEVDNVQKVRYYRDPAFKVNDPAAVLRDGEDALSWEPNFTAAAAEDVKGYAAMLASFLDLLAGRPAEIADAEAGLRAMSLLDACWMSWKEGREVRPVQR